ncbi:MAG: hypothetical protein IT457_20885, partial [Planctomycetes bacterium]|nr:hypothetical protein [Planctomycetota bacterium]
QDPPAAQDPLSRIDAELRQSGDLEALAAEWREGSVEQRVALAQARGDLTAIVAATEAATTRELRLQRALALEMLGRVPEALATIDALLAEPSLDRETAAGLELRRAELLVATRERGAAPSAATAEAFRRAASAAGDPHAAAAIGHLAAAYGLFDVALELHRPGDEDSPTARTNAHLRRAGWLVAQSQPDAARAEFAAAVRHAPLDRERAFALTKLLGLTTDRDAIRAFADDVLQRLEVASDAELEALLDALRGLGDGAGVLALFDSKAILARPALQEEIVAIAVECGRADDAIARARGILERRPRDHRLRVSLALLLTDQLRREEARAVLLAGHEGASHRELLALTQAAVELSDEDSFRAGLARLRASTDEAERVDALLLEVEALRGRGLEAAAAQLALAARETVVEPANQARLAGLLESLGRTEDAIALYRTLLAARPSEDLALRLGWLLSLGKDAEQRKESQRLFREVWLGAGSIARRAQAEEKVLDLAAREGTLADLALELEAALADPATPQRDQKREALVKIWTRAHDTFGARDVLLQWAREEPTREIEAWQAIAQVCLETDDYRGQEKALRHLMQIDPADELEYRQQLVLAFLERGRAGDARAVIREMLGRGGDGDAVALEFAAGIYALAGRPRDAARLYRRAYAVHPDRIETLLLWANAMSAQQRGNEAIGVFLDLLTRDVVDDLFLIGVDGLLNLSAPREALQFAERALRRRIAADPNRVFLQRALQDVLDQLGDRSGRLAVLEETVLCAGQQRSAWLREAMEEAAQEKAWPRYLGHARALLRSGDEVPPTVFVEIGEALLAANDLPGAERAFARARLAPDFAAIERRVAGAYEKARRFEDAERILRAALRRAPDDPAAIFAVARLAEQRGAREDALKLWSDVAVTLLRNETFAKAEERPRAVARNRRDDGPDAESAFVGVLRTARAPLEARTVRDVIFARLDGREPLDAAARRTLTGRLSRLSNAVGDAEARRRAREVEDELLLDEKLDARIRRELIGEALARGEVARLLALPASVFAGAPEERLRTLLIAGGTAELEAAIDALEPQALEPALRWLVLCGETALRDRAVARLREAVAADPKKLARSWQRVAPLVGETFDEAKQLASDLEEALAATGTPQVRGQRLLAALRAYESLDTATRERHARTVLALAREANDANFAAMAIEAMRGWLPDGELAPFVGIAFQKLSSPYLLASRAPLAAILPIDEAERVLRDAARPFGEEARTPMLQAVANGKLPEELARRLVAGAKLDPRAMSDNTWVTRIAIGEETPRGVLDELRKRLLRDAADDPRRTLLELRLSTESAERLTAAKDCALDLAAADQIDWNWLQLVDALVDATGRDERQTLRAALGDEPKPSPARQVLLAEFDRALGDQTAAAERLRDAALAQPDNLALQNRVVGFLELIGRDDDIARIYVQWVERAATVYPHQASQLASLLVRRKRPIEALAVLDRAEDEYGMTLDVRLRAALLIQDQAQRERELRTWQQRLDARGQSLGIRLFIRGGNAVSRTVTRAEVLQEPPLPAPAPASAEAAELDGDLLGFVAGAEPFVLGMLRSVEPRARLAAAHLSRGRLRSLRAEARHREVLDAAIATLAQDPHDAEALALCWAALQIGEPVAEAIVEPLFRRRALLADRDTEVLADLCWTALATGHDAILDRTLDVLTSDRTNFASASGERTAEGLVALVARRRPERLLELAPARGAPDVELDSLLLAHALAAGLDAVQVRDRFAAIGRRFDEREAYSTSRLRLPWAGLQLRLGEPEAALRVLTTEDLSVDRGDPFPGIVLASAIPPLARWAKPETAVGLGEALVAAIVQQPNLARRFLLFRVAALLAIRLDDAGRGDEAQALREKLAPTCVDAPGHAEWLVKQG